MDGLAFKPPFCGKFDAKRKKRTFRAFYKVPGVYIIKEDGVIVYVGMSSSNVCEAMYRHFYPWAEHRHTKQHRVLYLDLTAHEYTCAMFETSPEESAALERGMIVSLRPRDNTMMFEAYMQELSYQQNNQQEDKTPDWLKPVDGPTPF